MLRLLPLFEKFGLQTVALTGSPDSELARGADFRLIYCAPREACPLDLARRPARPLRWHWAMRLRWCCWKAAGSPGRILPSTIPPARSA